jgi:FixJ family two-component response regulator
LRPTLETVYIVEDDEAARALFSAVAHSMGLDYEVFARGADFLAGCEELGPGCLVLDLVLPDLNGLALQREMMLRNVKLPIIFVTGHGQVPAAVQAMRQGALNFLEKPFPTAELADNIREALTVDRERRKALTYAKEVRDKLGSLTQREQAVLSELVLGQSNKIIAHKLQVSRRSVELYRSRVMEKMSVRSLAELIRVLMTAGEGPGSAPQNCTRTPNVYWRP